MMVGRDIKFGSIVNHRSFDQIIREAEDLVMLQFWGASSVSCMHMTRILAGVINDPSVPFRVIRVKWSGSIGSPNLYGVHTTPTVLIFHRGELMERIIGLCSEQELREKLERAWYQPERSKWSAALVALGLALLAGLTGGCAMTQEADADWQWRQYNPEWKSATPPKPDPQWEFLGLP